MILKYIKTQSELKVMDYFLRNKEKSFSARQLMEKCNIHYDTTIKLIPELRRRKLIKLDKTVGKANLYKLNDINDFVEAMLFLKEVRR